MTRLPESLDLRFEGGKLSANYVSLFNKIALEIRAKFTDLVQSASEDHKNNLDWWVSSPASRNVYGSPLFYYCCSLSLLQQLFKNGEPVSKVITDSKAFKSVLEKKFREQRMSVEVLLVLTLKKRIKRAMAPFYHIFFRTPLLHIIQYLSAKGTQSLRKDLTEEALILIDTFIIRSNLNDRFYTGLWDSLTDQEKSRVYFVPTLLHQPARCFQFFKLLRTSDINYLIKNDYLSIADYWHAWKYWIRILRIHVMGTDFDGYNVAPMIQEDIRSFNGYYSAFLANLNYCFIKRLSKAGVKLKLVIDWFENQVIDKGFNAGLRDYYPEVPTKGYQGFIVTCHHLSMYPTKLEIESGLIPQEIAVIGSELVSRVKEFCPNDNINISVAPAFRFQRVWNDRRYYPEEDLCTILAALPIVLEDGNEILRLLSYCLQKGVLEKTRIWVKQHPNFQPDTIKKAFGKEWPGDFQFVSDDFNDLVERSNFIISSGSSSCGMNALAKGVPVIIVGGQSGLIHSPIPETITEDIWRICRSLVEFKNAIEFYKNRSSEKIKEHERIGRKIRDEYFEPVTREGVRRFLRLQE